MSTPEEKPKTGFARLSPEERTAMARLGGKSVPSHLRSFSQDPDLAAAAGHKGGSASRRGGRPRNPE